MVQKNGKGQEDDAPRSRNKFGTGLKGAEMVIMKVGLMILIMIQSYGNMASPVASHTSSFISLFNIYGHKHNRFAATVPL